MTQNMNQLILVSSLFKIHLYELEGSEGGGAVLAEHEASDAEELRVEAAVAQTEQEAAEQRHAHTATHAHRSHTDFSQHTHSMRSTR